jgi:hypothetical protein
MLFDHGADMSAGLPIRRQALPPTASSRTGRSQSCHESLDLIQSIAVELCGHADTCWHVMDPHPDLLFLTTYVRAEGLAVPICRQVSRLAIK